jgi:putative membrane protein
MKITRLILPCVPVLILAVARPSVAQTQQDKIFLQRASQSDFDEIKLSQMAAERAESPDVKDFANKMVTDHTNLEQQMKPFADQWGLQPADSLDSQHQTEYDKLSSLSGKDFDKEYIRCMDQDHHIALTDFQSELQTTKDPAFKKAVQQGEKVIAEHTRLVDHLDRKLGMTPSGSNQPT